MLRSQSESYPSLVIPARSVCNRFDMTSEANLQLSESLIVRDFVEKRKENHRKPVALAALSCAVDTHQILHHGFWDRTKEHLWLGATWRGEEETGSSFWQGHIVQQQRTWRSETLNTNNINSFIFLAEEHKLERGNGRWLNLQKTVTEGCSPTNEVKELFELYDNFSFKYWLLSHYITN